VDRRAPRGRLRGMTTQSILLSIILIGGFSLTAWLIRRGQSVADPHLKAELDRRTQEIGELKNQISKITSEKDEMAGKGRQLIAELTNIKGDIKAISNERDILQKQVNKFEEEAIRREKEQQSAIEKLYTAVKNSETEKARIIREDEKRQQTLMEERDRMWNDHEQNVIAQLHSLVKKEGCVFDAYDNSNLPEGFSGTRKPDFMIGFLDQYIIFDAKVSRSQDLQTYIKSSVKSTAEKFESNDKIYRTIFLVVPNDAVATLKQISFYEKGFHFYVISPAALEPILASFKKIETYEFAEAMDPQERENIIDLVAAFHYHISYRNAFDYKLIEHGIKTLEKSEELNPEILSEALIKVAKMRNLTLNNAEVKELAADPTMISPKMLELIEPKAKISKEDLKDLG